MADQEQQILSARIRLDIIPARRAKLQRDLKQLDREMQGQFERDSAVLVKRVKQAVAEKEAEVRAALAPFYDKDPDSRTVRRAFAALPPMPAVEELRRLHVQCTNNFFPQPPAAELVRWLLRNEQIVNRRLSRANETAAQ